MAKSNWLITNLSQRSPKNLCDFKVEFKPHAFERKSFQENSERVAKDMYDTYGKLYLTYSGGIDSEYVLKTFKRLDIPITPIIMVTPYNMRELQYAFIFCKENGILPEVITYQKDELIHKMYAKSVAIGFHSLLGALPLIAADLVNTSGGKLVTGYGECFKSEKDDPDGRLSTRLDFCEWDYYLDAYDSSHPSGFFSYDLPMFHSMLNEISFEKSTQQAKYELYQVEPRPKMYWDNEFYYIFKELTQSHYKQDFRIEKDELLKILL